MSPVLCKLRASWFGAPPAIGDFLKSGRGRTAYKIVTMTPTKTPLSAAQLDLCGEPSNGFVFECERWHPARVPANAVIHEWKWSARTKRPMVMR